MKDYRVFYESKDEGGSLDYEVVEEKSDERGPAVRGASLDDFLPDAKKHREEVKEWARRSRENRELRGPSELRF